MASSSLLLKLSAIPGNILGVTFPSLLSEQVLLTTGEYVKSHQIQKGSGIQAIKCHAKPGIEDRKQQRLNSMEIQ